MPDPELPSFFYTFLVGEYLFLLGVREIYPFRHLLKNSDTS